MLRIQLKTVIFPTFHSMHDMFICFHLNDGVMFQFRLDILIGVILLRYGFWYVVPQDNRSFHETGLQKTYRGIYAKNNFVRFLKKFNFGFG